MRAPEAVTRNVEIDLSYAARKPWVPSAQLFSAWAQAALVPPRKKNPVLSLRVVGIARSRSLNSAYRRQHKATNVLSFTGSGHMPDGRWYLGELVLCAAVVASEAREQRKSLEAHWAHMTVHGVLHLLGFDHQRRTDAQTMELKEIQILDRLGFSDPYR